VAGNELLVPGGVAAVPLTKPLDIERATEDFNPLSYWLGHVAAAEHVVHLKSLLSSLAMGVRRRHEADAAARAGGAMGAHRTHLWDPASLGSTGPHGAPPDPMGPHLTPRDPTWPSPPGMIINTSGWIDGAGFELLTQQATEFRADVLIVLGDDRLHSQERRRSLLS